MTEPRRPDFFIVGAPKCGTTAMASYLGAHPEIFMPVAKEMHFFGADLDYRRRRPTTEEYLDAYRSAGTARRVGEASIGYLYSSTAPAEILEFSPQADILIMLRDPVEMIASQHAQEVFMGHEDVEDVEAALVLEEERESGRCIPAGSSAPYLLRYRWLARYADHVERYLTAFGRERVHITIYDDLRSDTAAAFRQVVAFLGCDTGFTPEFPVVNRRKGPRSRAFQRIVRDPPPRLRAIARRLLPLGTRVRARNALYRLNSREARVSPMSPDLEASLRAEFAPEVRRLEALIGRELAAWRP